MKTLFKIVLAIALFPSAAFAQAPEQRPYERVLLPIASPSPIPGAYGSLWATSLVLRNEAVVTVDVTQHPGSCGITCPVGTAPPHRTVSTYYFAANPNAGTFMYVGNPGRNKVTFMLRVQDLSRQAQTWGTQIPVVREKDVHIGKLQLLDIPVDSHFRSALRVYDFDTPHTGNPGLVRVRVYDMCGIGPLDNECPDTPRVDAVIPLTALATPIEEPPASAMIADLVSAFPQLAAVPPTELAFGQMRPATVRIDIDPITAGLRFWGFVTATNNETQHVTLIAPE